MLWSYPSIEGGEPSVRQNCLYLRDNMVSTISFFVGYRNVRGSDFRLDKLMADRAYSFFAWTSGVPWCFKLLRVMETGGFKPWIYAYKTDALDLIGFFLRIRDWNRRRSPEVFVQLKLCCRQEQLDIWWSVGRSRHPNYRGEIVVAWPVGINRWYDKLKDISAGCVNHCYYTSMVPGIFAVHQSNVAGKTQTKVGSIETVPRI